MKKSFLLIATVFFLSSLFAQNSGVKIYVLNFTDKGVSSDAAINPSLYLSEKSVERRIKHQLAFDESDIPVNEQYVREVAETGAKIVTRSRWFNNVVVEATPEMTTKISGLPFITRINQLDNGTDPSVIPGKPFFENEKVIEWTNGFQKKSTNDVYDYGAAFNQINQLNGQYLHNNGFSGQGMTIAVLDAGFNSVDIMTCFDSLRANNQIKGTRDFAQPGNNVYATSMHSHGSMVLSCMGAYASGQMIGTAPKADYWLIRTEVGETEKIIEEYYWVSGAEFADSIGADLINSSLGYTVFDDPTTNHTYADMDGNTTFITIGADKAAEKGILVVNSAGNSGSINDPWKYIGTPADADSVFTIGAVNGSGLRASFSSLGPTYDGRIKPTVAAQGQGSAIFTPDGLAYGNGTSFSSPITCGITACLWQAFPDFNNMDIIKAIQSTATQANKPDSLLGWGIPDYQSAFNTLSVPDLMVEKVLITYPNPVVNRLTIGLPADIQGTFIVQIINLQGKIAYSYLRNEGSIRSIQLNDLGFLSPGIYLVNISSDSYIYSGKIIKM